VDELWVDEPVKKGFAEVIVSSSNYSGFGLFDPPV
jgi:hypothetical protein